MRYACMLVYITSVPVMKNVNTSVGMHLPFNECLESRSIIVFLILRAYPGSLGSRSVFSQSFFCK